MSKFKLPRKRKKQYKKDNYPFFSTWFYKESWEWFYFKRRVEVRCLEVIMKYPDKVGNEELLEWYKEYYPNDKLSHSYCIQNRHRFDIYNELKPNKK